MSFTETVQVVVFGTFVVVMGIAVIRAIKVSRQM